MWKSPHFHIAALLLSFALFAAPVSPSAPPPSASSPSSWRSIRVIVRDVKSGSLKSGQRNGTWSAANRSPKYAALVDPADDAKPCR